MLGCCNLKRFFLRCLWVSGGGTEGKDQEAERISSAALGLYEEHHKQRSSLGGLAAAGEGGLGEKTWKNLWLEVLHESRGLEGNALAQKPSFFCCRICVTLPVQSCLLCGVNYYLIIQLTLKFLFPIQTSQEDYTL